MAGMRVDRTLWQAVYGRSLGECFNQVREDLLGPTIMVALSPVGSESVRSNRQGSGGQATSASLTFRPQGVAW